MGSGLQPALILLNGTNINHTLVQDGWCWWYRLSCCRGNGGSHEFCLLLKYAHFLRSSPLRLPSPHSYNAPPCEAPMPFTFRPSRLQCVVTNNTGTFLKLPLASCSPFAPSPQSG